MTAILLDTNAYAAFRQGKQEAISIYRKLRNKGQPIPTNDMWIAATALQHGYALFSYDHPFLRHR